MEWIQIQEICCINVLVQVFGFKLTITWNFNAKTTLTWRHLPLHAPQSVSKYTHFKYVCMTGQNIDL